MEFLRFLGVRERFIFDDSEKPYQLAVRHIDNIQTSECPSEMVSQLSLMYAALKSEVVDRHKGKVELEAMDDVLPLSIYCVAMSQL